jgi:hypothetical protein
MCLLPEGWAEPERVEDSIEACGLTLRRAGISTRDKSGEDVTGSAAELDSAPRARAEFELLERVATLEAMRTTPTSVALLDADGVEVDRLLATEAFPESPDPKRWRYARSNGVALHRSWSAACHRAHCELVERDRVLRAWYGWLTPERVPLLGDATRLERSTGHTWRAFRIGAPDARSPFEVAGVFGFPTSQDVPIAVGYAARSSLLEAMEAASREALQLLAFLWAEPIPAEMPPAGPSALHHLDRLLCPMTHERLRAWLDGAHREFGSLVDAPPPAGAPTFVDLTPAWLGGGLRVAKAIVKDALPLAFGEAPFGGHLPHALCQHPIA